MRPSLWSISLVAGVRVGGYTVQDCTYDGVYGDDQLNINSMPSMESNVNEATADGDHGIEIV